MLYVYAAFRVCVTTKGRTPLESLEETYKKSHWYIGETKGDSPLHQASSQGEQNAVKTLISLGADLSDRNNEGDTPLHQAVGNGELATIKDLICLGADITARNKEGMTPLDLAEVAYKQNKDYVYGNIYQEALEYIKGLNDTSERTVEQSKNKDADTSSKSAVSNTKQPKDQTGKLTCSDLSM
ncbi:26S proteasome non-ATPase regulatory subunit 10-like [Mytilus californianus]|uniref:26S proteasome non-ATPase regulatory subunit 10-like n=1 Tax=Mytilus californianus TaxID=6549 RepID=UPI002247611E|nr:26S proteasome non-ATPase regulatory subunit 10-like [Mytilus californianus]